MDNTQINRLGFGAWAENVIVNYLEDWKDVMLTSEGQNTIDKFDEYELTAKWDGEQVAITVRAYVDGEGWQSLEQTIKLK
jgi:hypothetical protein